MPWNIPDLMSRRLEFVLLARQEGVALAQLCRRFGISQKTGWKWRQRFAAGGAQALADRSRRPQRSPQQVCAEVAEQVLAIRREHPTWGGRKLHQRLHYISQAPVPAASTCHQIVRRAGLHSPQREPTRPWQRFERTWPNQLWQMDHKGHFATQSGQRCHPLTVIDDHSRYNLVLTAAADQTGSCVQRELTAAFELYGLPEALLCDNAAPWGRADSTCGYTTLTVWLLRVGVRVLHGRPYHPQTQGKDERFHRTLSDDLLARHTWRDLAHCQEQFDRYRQIYNCERPHDSLGGIPPITRYRPSPRGLPSLLPSIEYPTDTIVRKLPASGYLMFKRQIWYIGQPFAGLPIGLRPDPHRDGHWNVYFCSTLLGRLDLTAPLQSTARSLGAPDEPSGAADRLPSHPSAHAGKGREPSPLP